MNLSHYLIGFSILAKGFAKLENHHDQIAKIIFIFIAGLFIITGTFFHKKIEKTIKNFSALFYIAEGIALVIIGLIFFEEGHSRISYFYFFIGVVFSIIGFFFLFTKDENKKKLQIQLQRWLGIAFIAAGILTFILNQIYVTNVWVNILSIVLIICGALMVVRSVLKKQSRIFK